MAYENSPIFTDETPGKKFFCTCGESATNLIVMVLIARKIQVSPPRNLPLKKLGDMLFVTVGVQGNFLFVMAHMQKYKIELNLC